MIPGIVILALGYVLSQFYRTFLAVLSVDLGTELGATPSDLSIASGTWFIVFALAQFPVGVWLDKFGPRRMTSVLFLGGAAGGALFLSFATTPLHLIIAMGFIGAGCSPILMAPLFIFAKSFAPAKFGLMAAWFVAFGTFGNVAGAKPLAILAEIYGWRDVMLGLSIISLVVGVGIYLLVRDPELDQDTSDTSGFGSFLTLLKLKHLWPIIPLMAIAYAIPASLRGYWAAPYLSEIFDADTSAIGTVTLWMALAMIAGSLLYGWLDNKVTSRKRLILMGNAIVGTSMLVLAIQPDTILSVATAMLVVCCLAGMNQPVLMAHARQFFPPHLVGRGITLMNFFSIGGVGILQWTTAGFISDDSIQNAPQDAFQTLFSAYVVVLGLVLIVYLAARERPNTA